MRIQGILLSCVLLLLASSSSAVPTLSLLSPATVSVGVGETVTIDLAVDNPDGQIVNGVDIELTGLQAAGAIVIGGQTAPHHFVSFCQPTVCFGGLNTIDNPNFDPLNLAGGVYSPGDDSVFVIRSLAFDPTSETGSIDPGLDGPFDVPSVRDVTIELTAATEGSHVLTVEGEFSDGVSVLPVVGTTITINVPEPSRIMASLASLCAVSVIAGTRRRHRRPLRGDLGETPQ